MRGDLLVYRSVAPVAGTVTQYTGADGPWVVTVELARQVSAVFTIKVNHQLCEDVSFFGRRVVQFTVPPAAYSGFSSLKNFLLSAQIEILADTDLLKSGGVGSSSISIGFGQSPQWGGGLEEALQRSIRFLLMRSDPLNPQRGGGLISLMSIGVPSEAVASRLVSQACELYNKYTRKGVSPNTLRVSKVTPLQVKLTSWAEYERSAGKLFATNLVGEGSAAYNPQDKVLLVSLKHTLTKGSTSFDVGSALTL